MRPNWRNQLRDLPLLIGTNSIVILDREGLCCITVGGNSLCESGSIGVPEPKPVSPRYRTTNWPEYNAALKQRGSLDVWFDPDIRWLRCKTLAVRVVYVPRWQSGWNLSVMWVSTAPGNSVRMYQMAGVGTTVGLRGDGKRKTSVWGACGRAVALKLSAPYGAGREAGWLGCPSQPAKMSYGASEMRLNRLRAALARWHDRQGYSIGNLICLRDLSITGLTFTWAGHKDDEMSGLGYLLIAAWSVSGINAHKATPKVQAISHDQRLNQTSGEWDPANDRTEVHFSPRADLGTSLVMVHLTIGRMLNQFSARSIADDSRWTNCEAGRMRRIIDKVAEADSLECSTPVAEHPLFR